jgi:hypothetical protein
MKSPPFFARFILFLSGVILLISFTSPFFSLWPHLTSFSTLSQSIHRFFDFPSSPPLPSSPVSSSPPSLSDRSDQKQERSLLFSEQDQALKKLIYGIFSDEPPVDVEEEWIEWTLSSPLSKTYVSREHTSKTQAKWMDLVPHSSSLYLDPALDDAAEEIARFYAQYGRFPPSTLLHFILEGVGASVWSIRQRLQSFKRPLSSEQVKKTLDTSSQ